MSLVLEREKRKNAGSKMAKLITEEEEDDFYKTAYGGFQEVQYELYMLHVSMFVFENNFFFFDIINASTIHTVNPKYNWFLLNKILFIAE